MRRDYSILKAIMIQLGAGESVDEGNPKIAGHLFLLDDGGFIEYIGSGNIRVTYKGFEFLDMSSENRVWDAFMKRPWPYERLIELSVSLSRGRR